MTLLQRGKLLNKQYALLQKNKNKSDREIIRLFLLLNKTTAILFDTLNKLRPLISKHVKDEIESQLIDSFYTKLLKHKHDKTDSTILHFSSSSR